MERHFEKELNNLKATLEKMSRLAQESLSYATRALLEQDKSLAEKTFLNERAINNLEIDIDQAVARKLVQHMVEEADAGGDAAPAFAIEID